jgi:hypothetical protein
MSNGDDFQWHTVHIYYLLQGSYVSLKHESDKLVVFDRDTKNGPLLFIFNFHPTNSFPDYKIGAPCSGEYVFCRKCHYHVALHASCRMQVGDCVGFRLGGICWSRSRKANLHIFHEQRPLARTSVFSTNVFPLPHSHCVEIEEIASNFKSATL